MEKRTKGGTSRRELTERLIITHSSPTLAGLKTANLFSCACTDAEKLSSDIEELNSRLSPKGVHAACPRMRDGSALIYIYRKCRLMRDLENETAAEILSSRGYNTGDFDACVAELFRRISECRASHCFPHEVGCFLGYPPADVMGFIENGAEGALCAGCWKVYGDAAGAVRTFEKYKKCAAVYYTQWSQGKSIERLTVADRNIFF
ncbi:MAG: DUF3793 family protein [Firmicutes bacterium]|nr:DUF3793 family protein [Bacillota bacterium]